MKSRTVRLGEVVRIEGGGTPSRDRADYFGGSIPWMTVKDFGDELRIRRTQESITASGLDNSASRLIPAGNVIVGTRMSVGRAVVNLVDLAINQDLKALMCDGTLHPEYLNFCLAFLRPKLSAQATGATVKGITIDDIQNLCIPLPSLPEQRRIAAVLEQADRLRRTRRYALDLADFFLPTAFLGMFGEPASNERGHPLQAVEELFPTGREGSKCGPFGSALRNEEYTPAGIPVWTMENIAGGEFREEGSLYISPAKYDELKSYTVQNGDILISRAGTVGRMAILATKHERSIIHSNLVRLTLDPQRCLPLYFTILMKHFGSAIGRLKRGAEDAYSFMNTGRISELRIPVPPLTLQRRFAALVAEHERLRAMQREALRQAEHLFQTLLHDTFADSAAKAAPERPLAICR